MKTPATQRSSAGIAIICHIGKNYRPKSAGGEFSTPLTELHDAWWNSIARAMA